jgi:GTP-binding protein
VIKVPPGTEISRENDNGEWLKIHDMTGTGGLVVVARGGLGGWGNARFATSTHRAPRIAQSGQSGEEVSLRLDLKLLADVGLVGLPNAGKSTLLRAMSAARPKVADYPFTTLEPVLGVVESGWETFVVADLPGLIEGAHEGTGLGLDFLRHIERTTVVVHLIDGSRVDPLKDMETVETELMEYGRDLDRKERIVAINKVDMAEVAAKQDELRRLFANRSVDLLFVSAASGMGVETLIDDLAGVISRQPHQPMTVTEDKVVPLREPDAGIRVWKEEGAFRVAGERVVAFAEMMPIGVEEGRAEVWRRFGRWGVKRALRRAGAKRGDLVRLGSVELEVEV